jgi:hypothetical protein
MTDTVSSEHQVRSRTMASTQAYLDLLRQQDWDKWIELWADDAILEFPFAPQGRPRTYHGKADILKYMSGTTESIAVDGVQSLRVHPMLDPETVAVELVIKGHLLSNGAAYDQTYVTMFEYQDGKIKHYREYWNPLTSMYAHGGYEEWMKSIVERDGE